MGLYVAARRLPVCALHRADPAGLRFQIGGEIGRSGDCSPESTPAAAEAAAVPPPADDPARPASPSAEEPPTRSTAGDASDPAHSADQDPTSQHLIRATRKIREGWFLDKSQEWVYRTRDLQGGAMPGSTDFSATARADDRSGAYPMAGVGLSHFWDRA